MRKQVIFDKKNISRLVMLILFIVSIIIISFFTSKPAQESNQTSKWLTKKIVNSIDSHFYIDRRDAFWRVTLNSIIRKLAHITEFALLGASSCGFFMMTIRKKWACIISISFCSLFAFFDEARQMFIEGRGPGWFDVQLDILGSIFGVLFVLIIYLVYAKIRRLKNGDLRVGD